MEQSKGVLSLIKSQVQQLVPDAKVLLFGSRAYGSPAAESDWDILILTRKRVNRDLKKDIHEQLFH